ATPRDRRARNAAQGLPRRHLSPRLRAHHRVAKRVDRPQGQPEPGATRTRPGRLTTGTESAHRCAHFGGIVASWAAGVIPTLGGGTRALLGGVGLGQLDAADLLGWSDETSMAIAVELDQELAPGKMDADRAFAPAVRDGGRGGRHRARARRQRLASAPLPDADGQVVGAVDTDQLDVRSFRETRMSLDPGAEPEDLLPLGFSTHYRVGVAD